MGMSAPGTSSRFSSLVRTVAPWAAALLVLLMLWPAPCVSSSSGSTSCQNALSLSLPWGESADTWGMVLAAGAAVVTFIVVRKLAFRLQRTPATI